MKKQYYDLSEMNRKQVIKWLGYQSIVELRQLTKLSVNDLCIIEAVLADLINNGLFTQQDLDNL